MDKNTDQKMENLQAIDLVMPGDKRQDNYIQKLKEPILQNLLKNLNKDPDELNEKQIKKQIHEKLQKQMLENVGFDQKKLKFERQFTEKSQSTNKFDEQFDVKFKKHKLEVRKKGDNEAVSDGQLDQFGDECSVAKAETDKSYIDEVSLLQNQESTKAQQPHITHFEKQLDILKTYHGVDWIKFENQIRQNVANIVEPAMKMNSKIQHIVERDVMNRLDHLLKMQHDQKIELTNIYLKFDYMNNKLGDQDRILKDHKELKNYVKENINRFDDSIYDITFNYDQILKKADAAFYEIQPFKETISSLESRIIKLNQDISVGQKKSEDFQSRLEQELKAKVSQLKFQVAQNSNVIKQSEITYEKLAESLQRLSIDVNRKQKRLDEHQKQIQSIQSLNREDVANLTSSLHQSSQTLLDQINKQADEFRDRTKKMDKNVAGFRSEYEICVNKFQLKFQSVAERFEKNESQFGKLQDDFKDIREWTISKLDDFEEQSGNLDLIKSQIVDINSNINELQLKVFHDIERLQNQQIRQNKISVMQSNKIQRLLSMKMNQSGNKDADLDEEIHDDLDIDADQADLDVDGLQQIDQQIKEDKQNDADKKTGIKMNQQSAKSETNQQFQKKLAQLINNSQGQMANVPANSTVQTTVLSGFQSVSQSSAIEQSAGNTSDGQSMLLTKLQARISEKDRKQDDYPNWMPTDVWTSKESVNANQNSANPDNSNQDKVEAKIDFKELFKERLKSLVQRKVIENLKSQSQNQSQNTLATKDYDRFMTIANKNIQDAIKEMYIKVDLMIDEMKDEKQEQAETVRQIGAVLAELTSKDAERAQQITQSIFKGEEVIQKVQKEMQVIKMQVKAERQALQEENQKTKKIVDLKIAENIQEFQKNVENVKKQIQNDITLFKFEQNAQRAMQEHQIKELIEESIDKFMMIVKQSEENAKKSFDSMQETFETLIRRYVAKRKTDKDMQLDELVHDMMNIKNQLKKTTSYHQLNQDIIKQSLQFKHSIQMAQISYHNNQIIDKCKYRLQKCLQFNNILSKINTDNISNSKQNSEYKSTNYQQQIEKQVAELQNKLVYLVQNFSEINYVINNKIKTFKQIVEQIDIQQQNFNQIISKNAIYSENDVNETKRKQEVLIQEYLQTSAVLSYIKLQIEYLVDVARGKFQFDKKEFDAIKLKFENDVNHRQKLEMYKIIADRDPKIQSIEIKVPNIANSSSTFRTVDPPTIRDMSPNKSIIIDKYDSKRSFENFILKDSTTFNIGNIDHLKLCEDNYINDNINTSDNRVHDLKYDKEKTDFIGESYVKMKDKEIEVVDLSDPNQLQDQEFEDNMSQVKSKYDLQVEQIGSKNQPWRASSRDHSYHDSNLNSSSPSNRNRKRSVDDRIFNVRALVSNKSTIKLQNLLDQRKKSIPNVQQKDKSLTLVRRKLKTQNQQRPILSQRKVFEKSDTYSDTENEFDPYSSQINFQLPDCNNRSLYNDWSGHNLNQRNDTMKPQLINVDRIRYNRSGNIQINKSSKESTTETQSLSKLGHVNMDSNIFKDSTKHSRILQSTIKRKLQKTGKLAKLSFANPNETFIDQNESAQGLKDQVTLTLSTRKIQSTISSNRRIDEPNSQY